MNYFPVGARARLRCCCGGGGAIRTRILQFYFILCVFVRARARAMLSKYHIKTDIFFFIVCGAKTWTSGCALRTQAGNYFALCVFFFFSIFTNMRVDNIISIIYVLYVAIVCTQLYTVSHTKCQFWLNVCDKYAVAVERINRELCALLK